MSRLACSACAASLCVASIIVPIEVHAQSQWLEPLEDNAIYVEILKPSLDAGDLTFLSSVWFLSGRWALSNDLILVAEIPLAFAEPDIEGFSTEMESDVGNIYVGVDWRGTSPEFFGELGLRLPIVNDGSFATGIGAFTEIVDRLEAFSAELVAVQAAANYMRRYPSGAGLRLRFSPIADFPTSDGDTEIFFLYSAQGWYESEGIALGGGVGGRWLVTNGDDLGESTLHQLILNASYEIGRFRPGLRITVPLDEDVSDFVDFVFGLTVAIGLD